MPLTLAQKSDVRRFLRYPLAGLYRLSPAGGSVAVGTAGYRYFTAYGQMEFRLNNLAPDEEARLTGNAYAAIAVIGPTPNVGDTLSVTFSGGNLAAPVTITVTVTSEMITATPPGQANPGLVNANAGLGIINTLAQYVNNNTTLAAAKIQALCPYGTGPFAQNAIPLPEVAFTSNNLFTISLTQTGAVSATITGEGGFLSPSLSPGVNLPNIYGYLPILSYLENAYGSASQDLSTTKADVWTARATEVPERFSLFMTYSQRMAEFLQLPMNVRHTTDFRKSSLRSFL